MDIETVAVTRRERVVEIPIPVEAWHETIDDSVEFEVQQVNLNDGHFGENYRRC